MDDCYIMKSHTLSLLPLDLRPATLHCQCTTKLFEAHTQFQIQQMNLQTIGHTGSYQQENKP